MPYTAEVKGKTADRYRAYTAEKMLRKPKGSDHAKRAAANLPPLGDGSRIRYDVEQVALQGSVTGAAINISTPLTITKVVFYKGPVEEEVTVGSVDVNATGVIDINLVEPPPEAEIVDEKPQIVDE